MIVVTGVIVITDLSHCFCYRSNCQLLMAYLIVLIWVIVSY